MKTTVFEVIEIKEHYGITYEKSLGLFQNQIDARQYFERQIFDVNPDGFYKLKVRTIH